MCLWEKVAKNDLMNEKDSKKRMKYEKQMKQENTYNGQDILKPKNDVVFQALFTRGSEYVTKSMIEDIIKIDIHKIDLDKSKDLLNDNARNKNGRLDIRAILNGNIDCDVEMQLVPHEKMIERFLYYWAKMYTANLKRGRKLQRIKKINKYYSVRCRNTIIKKNTKIPYEMGNSRSRISRRGIDRSFWNAYNKFTRGNKRIW